MNLFWEEFMHFRNSGI